MSTILRQSTQIKVRIGPAVAVGDGFTPVASLDLSTADEAELLKADGAATSSIAAATFAAITGADGWYDLTLTTSHTDTVGELLVVVNDDSLILPIYQRFQVIEEAAYDAIFAASAAPATAAGVSAVETDTQDIQARLPAALVNSRMDSTIDATGMEAGAVANIQAGLVMASGTIGDTGNDTTHLHLEGLTFGDDEINKRLLVVRDVSESEYHSAWIEDWATTGDLATLQEALPFTPQNDTDLYWLLPIRQDVDIVKADGEPLESTGVVDANMVQINGDTTYVDNFVLFLTGMGWGDVVLRSTIDVVTSQTQFTLIAGQGPPDNDAIPVGSRVFIQNHANLRQSCQGIVSDYTGATLSIQLAADPGIFTITAGNIITVLVKSAQSPTETQNANMVQVSSDTTAADTLELFAEALDQSTGQLDSGSFASGSFDAVWSVATRVLTAGTNIALAKGTGVTGFNDLSAAQVNAEVDTALADIHLDHFISSADPGGIVANDSILAKLVSKSATAAFSDYVNTTDSLQAIRDRGDAAWITATGFSTHSAADVWAVATRVLTAGTNIVLAKGTGVTGFTDLSAADVNAEVDSAIETYHLDHLFAATYDPASKPGAADALLNELVESDGGVARFTANALEEAPSGGGSDTALDLYTGTIANADATAIDLGTLGLGDDELNDLLIIVTDVSTGEKHSQWIDDYAGSTSIATLAAALPFTTEAAVDTFAVKAIRRDVTASVVVDENAIAAAVATLVIAAIDLSEFSTPYESAPAADYEGGGRVPVFSPDCNYLLQAQAASVTDPPIVIHHFGAAGYGDKVSAPASFLSANGLCGSWHPTGGAVATGSPSIARVQMWPFDLDAGTFGTIYSAPASVPTSGTVRGIKFSPTGGCVLIGWTGTGTPIQGWAFDLVTGPGTKFSDPVGYTTTNNTGRALDFHPTASVFYQALVSTPFIQGCEYDDATGFGDLISAPGDAPTITSGRCVAVHPNGRMVALVGAGTPFVDLWVINKTTGAFVSKHTAPGDLAAGTLEHCEWSADGKYLLCCGSVSPYYIIYEVTEAGGFIDTVTLETPPTSACNGITSSKDGNYWAYGQTSAPTFVVHKIGGGQVRLQHGVFQGQADFSFGKVDTQSTANVVISAADIRAAIGMDAADLDDQLEAITLTISSTGVVVGAGSKSGYELAATGLDLVKPSDPSAIPVLGTASIVTWIGWFGAWTVNEVNATSTTVALRNSADNADMATHTVSDNGSVFSNSEPS